MNPSNGTGYNLLIYATLCAIRVFIILLRRVYTLLIAYLQYVTIAVTVRERSANAVAITISTSTSRTQTILYDVLSIRVSSNDTQR